MRYGICKLSVIPIRKEMSHESELVSELLFNDIYEIIEEKDEWIKIKIFYDSYEGWIRTLQHSELNENEFKEHVSKDKYIVNEPFCIYNNMVLSFGSKIFENHSCRRGKLFFIIRHLELSAEIGVHRPVSERGNGFPLAKIRHGADKNKKLL